jgi:CubicO group peptidase (beta-lactamase class C family)
MRIVNAVLLVAVFAGAASFAQTAAPHAPLDPQQVRAIDSFVTSEMDRLHIPGVAVGVYSRGKILLAKGYGLANVELNVPVTPKTVFESGSVGKQFIATAIMMLAQDGKLSLDDSITKYFPDAPLTWKPIFIKNLLSHTSGLPDYATPTLTGPAGPFYLRLDFSEDQLLSKIEALPVERAPGEKWEYSNTNYVLLGILIHRVTGMPFAEFLNERIFTPLDMTSTRLISESDIIPNRAAGYGIGAGEQLKNQEWVSPTFDSTADGSLYLNILDMAKWDAALYGTQLLSQSSLDRMWSVYPLNDGKPNPNQYGFGWWIRQQNNHKVIEHGGNWQGFTCDISRYPDDNLTVVVLTNLDAAHSDPDLMAHVIAGLVDPPLSPAKLAAIPDSQPEIAATLAKVLDHVVTGQDVRPFFSTTFASTLTPEAIAGARATLANLWPGGSLTLVKRLTPPGTSTPLISVFRLTKADNILMILVFVDPDKKISNFRFLPNREYQ